MALQFIPYCAQSVAIPFVRLPTAPLVAVYGAIPGRANAVCTEAILIIFPCLRSIM